MENIQQFKRTYQLVIGDYRNNRGLLIEGDEDRDEGLNLKFDIKKHLNNAEESNEASIELYNLSEDSINYIQRPDISIFLSVGYGGDNKLLFQGIVKEVETKDNMGRQDRKTTLRCVPGSSLVYEPSISRTFPPNTSPRQIINFLIGQSPTIAKASFNSDSVDEKFPFGYSIQGTPKEILNDLSGDYGFTYRLDNKRLYVSDPNKYQSPNSVERAFVISPSTGLLGNPTYSSPDGKTNKDATDRKSGVNFTALCNALITPGSAVSIKDTVLSGIYRVNSAHYTGEWRANTWQVECWCSKLTGREA